MVQISNTKMFLLKALCLLSIVWSKNALCINLKCVDDNIRGKGSDTALNLKHTP